MKNVKPRIWVVLGRLVTLRADVGCAGSIYYTFTSLLFLPRICILALYCLLHSFPSIALVADCAMQQGLPLLPLYNRAQMNSVKLTDWQ